MKKLVHTYVEKSVDLTVGIEPPSCESDLGGFETGFESIIDRTESWDKLIVLHSSFDQEDYRCHSLSDTSSVSPGDNPLTVMNISDHSVTTDSGLLTVP